MSSHFIPALGPEIRRLSPPPWGDVDSAAAPPPPLVPPHISFGLLPKCIRWPASSSLGPTFKNGGTPPPPWVPPFAFLAHKKCFIAGAWPAAVVMARQTQVWWPFANRRQRRGLLRFVDLWANVPAHRAQRVPWACRGASATPNKETPNGPRRRRRRGCFPVGPTGVLRPLPCPKLALAAP